MTGPSAARCRMSAFTMWPWTPQALALLPPVRPDIAAVSTSMPSFTRAGPLPGDGPSACSCKCARNPEGDHYVEALLWARGDRGLFSKRTKDNAFAALLAGASFQVALGSAVC